MSQYANYALDSDSYDTTRIPVGLDTILACLARTATPLSQQVLLEAGCGTGNYLHALHPHVGSLSGIDFSEGMLTQARRKLDEQVGLTCGSILDMAFEDESFDGITCNQVIHHLEEGPSAADDPSAWEPSQFPNMTQFTREAWRVLKPGGAFVINATTHDQFRDGYWWAALIPTAVSRLVCRMPDFDQLQQILREAGFEIESVEPELHGILQGSSYLDPEGPLKEAWRAGDSTWSLVTETELADAQHRVEQMNSEGTIQAWLDEREQYRSKIGQTTFICARK
ncbi:MAG: methyltransferase domain-containing protein [Fuerstiella sp.]|jgi:ubiquinone/menaquinone biosynthesis C-methylase UbiE|nr:methyltransferase domain-containing protein [Fuerstiella sp.]MCP4506075.1 methyltransferase domain-containing protein [Fuerstiella sp.]MDG2127138.1 methyltransferase domain-containing protein [Fuerstiella sp.]